jgi:hypothetical protein
MNLGKVENVLHAVVALSFGVGLLVAFAPPARAETEDWVALRVANGLPVDPKPSLPGELPTDGGPVPDTLLVPLPDAVAGNGNGNGHGVAVRLCEDPFAVELARSDGDVGGEDAKCK